MFIRDGINKVFVRIANREDPDKTASLIWVFPVLSGSMRPVSFLFEHI